jgi:predicted dehydrogenase
LAAARLQQNTVSSLVGKLGISVTWACDVSSADKLTAFQQRFGIKHQTRDYWDILNDPQLNTVYVCTPPSTHLSIAKDVLRANKNLILEKPLVINEHELISFSQEVKNHPELLVMDGSARHSRLQPKFPFVKEMISSGKLGDIYFIHHRCLISKQRPGIESNPGAVWFLDKEQAGGGCFFDWGVYDLSFHLGILEEQPELLQVNGFLRRGLDDEGAKVAINTVEEHGFCNDGVFPAV